MESTVVETHEHETTEQCWCQPVLDYVDPQTGNQVWVHNEAPNECVHRGRTSVFSILEITDNSAVSGAADG